MDRTALLTFDIDSDGQRYVLFANGAKQSAEVDEPVDPVVHDDFLQTLEVEDVGEDEGSVLQALLRRLDYVWQYDIFITVISTQQFRTLRAQLSKTT